MKSLCEQSIKMTVVLFSLLIMVTACSKDDDPDPKNPDSPTENPDGTDPDQEPEPMDTVLVDPDKVTQSLIFDNMSVIAGTPPSVNTLTSKLVSDLKIDRDTIFWTEGIIKRLLVKRPEGVSLKGFWVYVEGAHSYIEATFREEEETEEIDVLYFDFDPTEWDLDFSFPLDLIPFDEDGIALDKFETKVEVEKPLDDLGNCEFNYTYKDENNSLTEWQWIFSHDPGIDFLAAPMLPFNTDGSTQGCCSD